MIEYVCVKEVIITDNDLDTINNFKKLFTIGNIYKFVNLESSENSVQYFLPVRTGYYLLQRELNEYFIPLEEWRELRINKILENDNKISLY